MLEAVGIGGPGADDPRQLSGGGLQRVAIARALIHRPALILADEPTDNLDPETTADVIALMVALFPPRLQHSLSDGAQRIDRVLAKSRYWQQHQHQGLLAEKIKVLNRLLDGGERGFEQGLTASKYQAVAKVSKATATRHLADLLALGCLERVPGGGRSTRYQIRTSNNKSPLVVTGQDANSVVPRKW